MATESLHPGSGPARRTVMAAAGAAGLTAALAACGSGDGDGNGDGDGGEASSGTVLGATSEIPEGGGKVFADAGVVVTQPTAGDFKAFSSKCTHQGCAVKDIRDGLIICPCHDSHFSATDGSVKKGPATKPLPPAGITVEGEEIKLT
ncbi:Rieske (2Fe-2S) protein [Streptomyces sp. NPDC052687]|uniref:Rieske (2Fe-2S) protein n=1 Tax=Streptomyces sp. NPDC052687 TaxID=3154759 RepID=UPI00341C15ED